MIETGCAYSVRDLITAYFQYITRKSPGEMQQINHFTPFYSRKMMHGVGTSE